MDSLSVVVVEERGALIGACVCELDVVVFRVCDLRGCGIDESGEHVRQLGC
jgi:hypothetical protein